MSISQTFTEFMAAGRVNKRNGTSTLFLSQEEMEEMFGSSFSQQTIKGRDWNFTLFFEENDRLYFTSFETVGGRYKFSTSSYEEDQPVFYREPSDVYLQHFKSEYEKKIQEMEVYERVLNHPKNRLKSLFF